MGSNTESWWLGRWLGSLGVSDRPTISTPHLHPRTHAGTKKAPKVYSICVHPYQPHLVVVGTNTGSALLSLTHLARLPITPLPLKSPTLALAHDTGLGQLDSAGSATFMAALGDKVACITCHTLPQVGGGMGWAGLRARGCLCIACHWCEGVPVQRMPLVC